jgi:phospholipid/cholesterol/gamma-HCH transport system substrate-binding protein
MEAHLGQQVKVGLFVVCGLIAAMISILVLGGDRAFFTSYSLIESKMTQVQGLAKGSIVSLAGVTVGNVDRIKFAEGENALIIVMKINTTHLERIPVTSTIEVRTQGALGDKFVYINPGDLKDEKLKEGGTLAPAESTDLMNVLSQRGGEAANVFDIINEMKKLLVAINRDGRMEKLMGNMAEASVQLKEMSAETRKLVSELRGENPKKITQVLTQLDSILAKVDRGEGTLGALINDSSLHDQLKTLVGTNPRKKYLESIMRTSIKKSDSN